MGILSGFKERRARNLLLDGIHQEDIGKVMQAIERGAPVDGRAEDGSTALMGAVIKNNIEIARFLVGKGADINAKDRNGWTPLLHAVSYGHMEAVSFLIERGADVNVADTLGVTPLMSAALRGHADVMKLLLNTKKVSTVNAQAAHGQTALMSAAEYGHIEIVRLLLDNGADVNFRQEGNVTALMIAAHVSPYRLREHTEIVKLLLEKGADASICNDDGMTARDIAAKSNDLDIVHLLGGYKPGDPYKSPLEGMPLTPLPPPIRFITDETPSERETLAEAARLHKEGQSEEALKQLDMLLAAAPGHLEALDKKLEIVYVLSRLSEAFEIAEKIIAIVGDSAEISEPAWRIKAAVLLKLERFDEAIACAEMATRADPTSQEARDIKLAILQEQRRQLIFGTITKENATLVLADAMPRKNWEGAKKAVLAGADVNLIGSQFNRSILTFACMEGQLGLARLMVQHGADVNHKEMFDRTPLMLTVMGREKEAAALLLKLGADVNLADDDGETALIMACTEGSMDMVSLLVENGAEVNTKDKHGMTPLIYACAMNAMQDLVRATQGMVLSKAEKEALASKLATTRLNIARFLVGNGADVNVRSADGETLKELAASAGYNEIVAYLNSLG